MESQPLKILNSGSILKTFTSVAINKILLHETLWDKFGIGTGIFADLLLTLGYLNQIGIFTIRWSSKYFCNY